MTERVVGRILGLLSPFMTGIGQKRTVLFCMAAGVVVSVSWHVVNDPNAGYGFMLVDQSFYLGALVGGAIGVAWIVVAALAFALFDLYNDTHSGS